MTYRKDDIFTDKYLIASVLKGNHHAFGLIIKQTEGLVAQITFRMIKNPGDRKDIAQDVYMKVFKRLGSFRFNAKLSTWIGQIAYNTCLHYLEKKKLVLSDGMETDEEMLDKGMAVFSQDDLEQKLFAKELSAILNAEIDLLKPLYKTLISLYHQSELSYTEIAEITSLPEGTVKNYLFRARKALKENILLKYKRSEL